MPVAIGFEPTRRRRKGGCHPPRRGTAELVRLTLAQPVRHTRLRSREALDARRHDIPTVIRDLRRDSMPMNSPPINAPFFSGGVTISYCLPSGKVLAIANTEGTRKNTAKIKESKVRERFWGSWSQEKVREAAVAGEGLRAALEGREAPLTALSAPPEKVREDVAPVLKKRLNEIRGPATELRFIQNLAF
jgi:hypothetical protein